MSGIFSCRSSSETVKTIDARPEDLEKVLAILDRHLPGRDVRAFGSRVAGKAKAFSDLDLAVMGEEPLPASVMADVREAFRESDLPFKVDVLDWATTAGTFRHIIEQQFLVVREAALSATNAAPLRDHVSGP